MNRTDNGDDGSVVDVRRSRQVGRLRLVLIALVGILVLSGRALVSWYVDALWFGSLGYSTVFWKTLSIKAGLFGGFLVVTTVVLAGVFMALRPHRADRAAYDRTIIINGRPVTVSFKPVTRFLTWGVALLVGVVSGLGMAAEWTTFVLYWHGAAQASAVDPVFGRPITFYLLALPAWQLLATWLTTLAFATLVASVLYFVITNGERAFSSVRGLASLGDRYGGVSLALGVFLLVLAGRVCLSRFDRLFQSGTVFSGAGYADVHIVLPGLLLVMGALLVGSVIAFVNAVRPRRLSWLVASLAPAVLVYAGLTVVSWYVKGFIVAPNALVRETPYIRHNIQFTQRAFVLSSVEQRAFPGDSGLDALELEENRATLDNVRLWDWRALQDTLRQIQAIRTYYDFPDIDIDRYRIAGQERQVMVAAREMNLQRLPENSRNWINEKLIYTHGYGLTMNPVNGFTAEGLPQLVLSDMPVQSTSPDIKVTRPEIYFGQLTTSDVYVRTRQKEFNYPEGENNNYSQYDGKNGIRIGSMWRRLLIGLDRGDLSKVPFSDDIGPDSLLLMRREIRERVSALAPFLSYDPDPYIVVGVDGRLYWMIDGFTSSNTYPYAKRYRLLNDDVNYIRNSVKVVVDAYDGTAQFYVFDDEDPIIQAYRRMFPDLFLDGAKMPAGVRRHVRYPELLLKAQATVYSLYHMSDPQVFYNREDLWSVASQVSLSEAREQVTQPVEPNFVLMKLAGGPDLEFVEILPFTPSKRNNLIGWIAARSDGAAYGKVLVYNFPKTRMIDGPLQIEARIDQNPQLSPMLSLWNQQGSHVRRGSLLVIPIGRTVFYAEPIYLQAERSPMPQLRLVVLALQDRMGYGPTFDAAMKSLLSENAIATRPVETTGERPDAGAAPPAPGATAPTVAPLPGAPLSTQALIEEAAKNLADYQRLTAEGKLGEAGQKLEALKKALDQLRAAPPPKK
jgi:hypothetical protein